MTPLEENPIYMKKRTLFRLIIGCIIVFIGTLILGWTTNAASIDINASGNGWAYRQNNSETWEQTRNGVGGNSGTDCSNQPQVGITAGYNTITRLFWTFDSSALPDDAVISTASVFVYNDGGGTNPNSISYSLVPSDQASNTEISNTDYETVTFDRSSNSLNLADIASAGWHEFVLNTTGTSIIIKDGFSHYAMIGDPDLDNSSVANLNYPIQLNCVAGSAKPPYLHVEYTTTSTPPTPSPTGSSTSMTISDLNRDLFNLLLCFIIGAFGTTFMLKKYYPV